MAIFRGVGGSGDSSDNSFLQEVTAQANSASASATAAANSATSALNTELTSASFNTSDGVLTLTKQDGDTVTADLDGRFLTSYTETDPVFTAHVANSITATNISNWNTAYNNHITAVDYSGSTLTLTQQDGGTLTTTINGALGSTLSHNGSTKIEAISSGVTVTGDITVSGTVDGRDLATDGTKLDGIEANATADQTGSEIKTAYEAESDTNAFTDAEKTKLSGIEASATADQTDAEIKTAYENNADTNVFTDAEKTKLSNIEANADVTDTANVTSAGALMTTGGEMTGNITFSGTQTVDGRDLSVDGARLDSLKGTLTQEYYNTLNFSQGADQALTTTLTRIGDELFVKHSGDDYKTTVDLLLDINWSGVTGSNDAYGYLTVTAPNPSSESAIEIGTSIAATSGVSYIQEFYVTGDWTSYMSPYAGLSKTSNGSSSLGLIYKWVYNPHSNRTTFWVSLYTNPPGTGSTIYLHPFDWESSGTEINGQIVSLDNTSIYLEQGRRDFKFYLGRFTSRVGFEFKAREMNSADNVTITNIRMSVTEVEG